MQGAKHRRTKDKRRPSGSGSSKIPLITLDLFLSGFVGREAYGKLYFSNLNVEAFDNLKISFSQETNAALHGCCPKLPCTMCL